MKTLFARQMYIRLSEDGTHFIYTAKYGRFYAKATEVALNCQPTLDAEDKNPAIPARKRFSGRTSEEE